MISCILLAISVSIDALTLGITYGIKHSRINKISNLIVFSIAFVSTSFAIFLGKHISRLFSPSLATFIGSALLILLGIYSIYKSFNKNTALFILSAIIAWLFVENPTIAFIESKNMFPIIPNSPTLLVISNLFSASFIMFLLFFISIFGYYTFLL